MHSRAICALLLALAGISTGVVAQSVPPVAPPRRQSLPLDSARAARLYVSNRAEDLPKGEDYAEQTREKRGIDSTYAARSAGIMEFRKVTYKSRSDGRDVPAYLFAPLAKRGANGHAAMVWVHGGVHSSWGATMLPFVREAVQRGYVVITPDYRGSTGYGAEHYEAIDYGGKEVDDVISAVDYLKTLPYVDMARLGIMGWSHGGFITAQSLFRHENPF